MRLLSSVKITGLLLVIIFLSNCSEVNTDLLAPESVARSYSADIKPIFDRSCVRCHGNVVQNGITVALNLSSYASIQNFIGDSPSDDVVIVPGSPSSRILNKLNRQYGGMYQYLSDPGEFELIYDWVVAGNATE